MKNISKHIVGIVSIGIVSLGTIGNVFSCPEVARTVSAKSLEGSFKNAKIVTTSRYTEIDGYQISFDSEKKKLSVYKVVKDKDGKVLRKSAVLHDPRDSLYRLRSTTDNNVKFILKDDGDGNIKVHQAVKDKNGKMVMCDDKMYQHIPEPTGCPKLEVTSATNYNGAGTGKQILKHIKSKNKPGKNKKQSWILKTDVPHIMKGIGKPGVVDVDSGDRLKSNGCEGFVKDKSAKSKVKKGAQFLNFLREKGVNIPNSKSGNRLDDVNHR